MMKAIEYRIGNIVMGNKPFALKANDIALAYHHEKFKGEPRWGDVPLTEEWLLKFGFVWKNGALRLGNFTIHMHESFMFYYSQGGFNNGSIKLTDVHQVQNLYFALTGEELEIKDKDE